MSELGLPAIKTPAPGLGGAMSDLELPGTWETADFTGGQDEIRPAPPKGSAEPASLRERLAAAFIGELTQHLGELDEEDLQKAYDDADTVLAIVIEWLRTSGIAGAVVVKALERCIPGIGTYYRVAAIAAETNFSIADLIDSAVERPTDTAAPADAATGQPAGSGTSAPPPPETAGGADPNVTPLGNTDAARAGRPCGAEGPDPHTDGGGPAAQSYPDT